MNKKYEASPIPNKENLSKKELLGILRGVIDKIMHPETIELDENPFAEIQIEFGSVNTSSASARVQWGEPPSVPKPQNVPLGRERDPIRAKFTEMRRFAGSSFIYRPEDPKVFYRQAVFMCDFEDEYDGETPFSSYYPSYQTMGYEQLRTYFTWRTRVRRGSIGNTSVSYAFLYIYELLNNIGVESPDDGLEKLMVFWTKFREFDDMLDKYMLQWLKEYHIYYPTTATFREFAERCRLQACYPNVFAYYSTAENSYDIYTAISKYDIQKSIFVTEETLPIVKNAFWFVLNRLREEFHKSGKLFEDLVFYSSAAESLMTPFKRALFYPTNKYRARKVAISEREVYTPMRGSWMYKPVILTDPGQQLVGFIMKSVESELRKTLKFKYKITANPDMLAEATREGLAAMGLDLPAFIKSAVTEFRAGAAHKKVTVNPGNLERIRREALGTQEKLIVPEDKVQSVAAEPAAVIVYAPAANVEKTGVWEQFRESLTSVELNALGLILLGGSIGKFAASNALLPEVLIDGINQKAVDFTGDTVMEYDGNETVVYDEYREYLENFI